MTDKLIYASNFKNQINKVLDTITETIVAELHKEDAGRFQRVVTLATHAGHLLREAAESVGDFAATEEFNEGIGLGGIQMMPRLVGRRRHPIPLGNDTGDLQRNLTTLVEDQTGDQLAKTKLKQLELLIRMKAANFDSSTNIDTDLKEIYGLVRTDVLRGLQTQRQGQKDATQGDASDGAGEEAAPGVSLGSDQEQVG